MSVRRVVADAAITLVSIVLLAGVLVMFVALVVLLSTGGAR